MRRNRGSGIGIWFLETFPGIALAWGGLLFLIVVTIWLLWPPRELKAVLLPFVVPPKLAERGYDGDVVARRVLDAMLAIVETAHAPHNRSGLPLPERLPRFRVPGLNVEYGDLLALSGRLELTKRLPSIGGDIVLAGESDKGLALRLRFEHWPQSPRVASVIDVRLASNDPSLPTGEALDQLIEQAAHRVMAFVAPITDLAYRYASPPRGSGASLDRAHALRAEISAFEQNSAKTGPERSKAALLLGLIQEQLTDTPEAQRRSEQRRYYELALVHDPRNGAAHNNLGRLEEAEAKLDEAARRYGEAIKAEPKLFLAYQNLILLHCGQGRSIPATSAWRQAERNLDPAEAERLRGEVAPRCEQGRLIGLRP